MESEHDPLLMVVSPGGHWLKYYRITGAKLRVTGTLAAALWCEAPLALIHLSAHSWLAFCSIGAAQRYIQAHKGRDETT